MSILDEKDCILMIIDVQGKLLNAVYNKESLSKKAYIMAKTANLLSIPVLVTEQYPKGLGQTVDMIKSEFDNEIKIFEKRAFSALDEESVFDFLKSSGKNHVIILGIETHICVSQTVNSLIEFGYEVSVIKDACGSRNKDEHDTGIEIMRGNGARIISAEIAVFELLRTSKHPYFKQIQELIK